MPNAPLDPQTVEALTAEIRLVEDLVRKHVGAHNALLVRPAPAMDPAVWQRQATQWGLEHWLLLTPQQPTPAIQTLVQHMEELRQRCQRDPLTGLPNRAGFTAALALEVERTQRTGAPTSLAIFDVDDFKRFNDTYGHPCGDEALRTLGRILATAVRRLDTAARLGGEEFALILPATSRYRAQGIVERILEAVRSQPVICGPHTLSITCSAGVATARGREKMRPEELYAEADRALYRAKSTGKNRVEFGAELGAPQEEALLVHQDEKRFLFHKG